MKQQAEVGAALRAALEERGCALGADEARALAVSLIGLINDGLLAVPEGTENVPAYNMGHSVYTDELNS